VATPDIISILEAAYAPASSDAEWLHGVASAALPSLQYGCGLHAHLVDLSGSSGPLLREPIVLGATPEWEQNWRRNWWDIFIAPMDPFHVKVLHTFTTVSYATDLFTALSEEIPTYAQYLSKLVKNHWGSTHARFALPGDRPGGSTLLYPDSINIACLDAEWRGCALIANLPKASSGPVPRALARTWSQVAAHVAAGYRLRRSGPRDPFATAEAVIDPGGRVAHAVDGAKVPMALEAIRTAAAAVDRARLGRERKNSDSALAGWRALAAGRWSVLDHFDRDGRRYFLAQPNETEPRPRLSLTRREAQIVELVAQGHTNKQIAYELGLSPSTISSQLVTATRKLGTRSRVETILSVRGSHPARR
jgi:DNA-binding CsgD family transcriptional regulator